MTLVLYPAETFFQVDFDSLVFVCFFVLCICQSFVDDEALT